MSTHSTFSRPRIRLFCAVILSLTTATILIPGMTVYLPFNKADQIAMPTLLFPFIWCALVIYSYMAKKWWQPLVLMLGLMSIHGALIAYQLLMAKA